MKAKTKWTKLLLAVLLVVVLAGRAGAGRTRYRLFKNVYSDV